MPNPNPAREFSKVSPHFSRLGALLRRSLGIATVLALGPSITPIQAQEPDRFGAYVNLAGVDLWYIDTGGTGEAIVFLHAATGSSLVWEHQISAFTQARYRFISFDRRGWGRTRSDSASTSTTAASEDLRALADHLGLDRFHLMGTAAGGSVAFDFALSHPERLHSLVIANSLGGIQSEEASIIARRIRPPEFSDLPPDLRELGPEYRAANPSGRERWLDLVARSRPNGPPSVRQPLVNRITLDALESLSIPTLIIMGGADMYSPPTVMRLFGERIPGAEFVHFPDVGHSAFWEAPKAFNAAILDFVGR